MGLDLQSLFARGPAPLLGIDFSASSVKVVDKESYNVTDPTVSAQMGRLAQVLHESGRLAHLCRFLNSN